MTDKRDPSSKGYILRMTLPVFLVQLMQILVNNIDQLMVSAYSQSAVAAIGNANQISWVLIMMFNILGTASVILITQYKGAGQTESERELYPLAMGVNMLAGIAIGAVCVFWSRPLFALMNVTDPEVLEYACQYLRITGGSIIFVAVTQTYNAFFRSNSLMKQAMFISAITNVVNIIGNWLLISGRGPFPALGVRGAAIATVFSRFIGLLLLVIGFRLNIGRMEWSRLHPFPFRQLGRMLAIGVPSAGESISYDITQLMVMSFINTLGLVEVNTKIYIYLIVSFCYIFASSLGETTQVCVGWYMGAGRPDDADRRVRQSLRRGVACSVVLSALVCLFSDRVLGLFLFFGNDVPKELTEGILYLGHRILMIEIVLEFGRACNLILVRSLQAAGDIRFPVMLAIVSAWFFSVGGGYLLGIVMGWGLVGIWIAMCCDEVVRGIILNFRWRKGGWKKIRLIEKTAAAALSQEEKQSAEPEAAGVV